MIFLGNLKNNIPTQEYIDTLTSYTYADKVGIALPLTYISKYEKQLHENGIFVGSQCVDLREDFANRGEIHSSMLKDIGTDFVFFGHRTDKKLTVQDYVRLRKKIEDVISNDMIAVVSIGETMEEYEMGKACSVVEKQIKEICKINDIINEKNFIFAYEPKWAIGTGLNVSVNELNSTMKNIKSMVEAYAKKPLSVIFGGSCNVSNIPKYSDIEEIEGFAISSACLDVKQFVRILCGMKK